MTTQTVHLTVNGEAREAEVEPRLLLVHFLREDFRLTGTHIGCDTSNCGACTVLLDGRAVKSCTMFAVQADGARGHDRRGAGQDGDAPPAPGGLLGGARPAVRLLHAGHADDSSACCSSSNPDPTEDEIRAGISGNLCRCTGYVNIVKADPARGGGRCATATRRPSRQRQLTRRPRCPTQQTTPEVGGMGHSIKRKEDPRFIRGKGNYVDDIKLPGMLYLDIVRSPYAHAKITSIDTVEGAASPRRAGRDHRQGPREVQPALDADPDVATRRWCCRSRR